MPGASLNVLIVDDEPATRTVLAEIFAQRGNSVRSAQDGLSALEQIREAMPDVLLSDLNMPGMSGFELLSVVRRRLPGIYVIATSGAYSGDAVPVGIAADAFYEKATGVRNLVSLLEGASAAGVPERGVAKVPVWVPRAADRRSDEPYVMISCPECLRAFPETFDTDGAVIRETRCTSCRTAIEFAVVDPLDPLTSQPY